MHDIPVDIHMPSGRQGADYHDVVTRLYAEEVIAAFEDQIRDVERLAGELQNLLTDCAPPFGTGSLTEQKEILLRWTKRYSSGVAAVGRIARDSHAWLREFSRRLNPETSRTDMAGSAEKELVRPYIPAPSQQAWSRFPMRRAARAR